MSEMKQRIARAIYDSLVKQGGFVINDDNLTSVTIDDNFDLTEVAMAVLAEVETAGLVIVPRKPTEAMVQAGGQIEVPAGDYNYPIRGIALEVWQDMLAVAPKR